MLTANRAGVSSGRTHGIVGRSRNVRAAMRRTRLAGAVALLLTSATGCARVAPPASAPPTVDAALDRMHATFRCGNGVQATAKIDHFGERQRVRADLMLFAA